MSRCSALQGILHVPRGGLLQAELRQRVCLQYGDHDGGRLAFDGDGGGGSRDKRRLKSNWFFPETQCQPWQPMAEPENRCVGALRPSRARCPAPAPRRHRPTCRGAKPSPDGPTR